MSGDAGRPPRGRGGYRISAVRAREILDSRGLPTIEVDVITAGGATGRAAAPAGASTGRAEARELRDGGPRYQGQGVRGAVAAVRQIVTPALAAMDVREQAAIDRALADLDGTPERRRLGANTTVAVSLAVARAAASALGLPLYRCLGGERATTMPLPLVNVLSGGRHARGGMDFQDVMVVPVGAADFAGALEMAGAVRRALGALLEERCLPAGLADEGGFGPPLASNEAALALASEAIERAGYRPGEDVALALDVAASQLQRGDRYVLTRPARELTSAQMIQILADLCHRYPLVSLEDGLGEEDWTGWRHLTETLGSRLQLVGDDLFVTRRERIERGIREGMANAVLLKPNQVGTLTETRAAAELARGAGYRLVLSARSGETEDPTLADLAVGLGVQQVKVGSLACGERTAKYNQLLRIAEELGPRATWLGRRALAPGATP